MDRFYKISFIIIIIFTLFVIGYTFNKTVVKSNFIMIEDEETAEGVASDSNDQSENTVIQPSSEDNTF